MTSLEHDIAFATAKAILDEIGGVLSVEEYKKLHGILYHAVRAALDQHQQLLEHRRYLLNPTNN